MFSYRGKAKKKIRRVHCTTKRRDVRSKLPTWNWVHESSNESTPRTRITFHKASFSWIFLYFFPSSPSFFFFFFFSTIPRISSRQNKRKSLGKDGIEVFSVTKKSNLTERCFGPGRWAEIVNNDFPEIGQTSLESKHFHRSNWFNSRICMIRVGTSVIYCLRFYSPLQFWSCSISVLSRILDEIEFFLFSLDIDNHSIVIVYLNTPIT